MKRKFFSGLVALVLMTVLLSCNKAPQTEIETAQTAVNEAQATGADMYLQGEYNALKDSMNKVLLSIESKKSKWFASYKNEKDQLNEIVSQAITVKTNTEIRKNEIRDEILSTLTNIRKLLDENQELLSKAPKGKEGAAALMAIKDELAVLNVSVNEITNMVESGDFMNAQTKVSAVNDKTLAINTELRQAIDKYNSRQGRK